MTDITPGQMWVWSPDIPVLKHIKPFWPLPVVNDKSRGEFVFGDHVNALPNDVFTVVSTDDEGPFEPPLHIVDLTNDPKLRIKEKDRYHIVLLRGQLVWMKHNELVDNAKIVS